MHTLDRRDAASEIDKLSRARFSVKIRISSRPLRHSSYFPYIAAIASYTGYIDMQEKAMLISFFNPHREEFIMRTMIAIVLVASVGATTLVQAQTLPSSYSDTSSVRIAGVAPRPLTDEQFDDFSGKFKLSNGKRLEVFRNNYHYYAQFDGERQIEILPTARDKEFVAARADMQINFDELRGGKTVDVVIRTGMRSNNLAVLTSQ